MKAITHIEIDRLRKLKFDFNAMADLEAATGKTLMQTTMLLNPMMSSVKTTVAVLWAGLKWEDASMQDSSHGIRIAGELAQVWTEKSGGNYGDLNDVLLRSLIDAGWLQEGKDEDTEGDGQGEADGASVN